MKRTLCKLWIALTLASITTGCEQEQREETVIFEEAEKRYRTGDYDAALNHYKHFLVLYPRSPLAKTAKLRIRTIDREVETIMDARSGNRPLYVKPGSVTPRSTAQDKTTSKDKGAPPMLKTRGLP